MTLPWSALRIFALAAGVLGTLFWLGAIVQWWRVEDSHRDGFEFLGLVLAHIFFVALVLPTLIMGLLNRWLVLAAVTAIFGSHKISQLRRAVSEARRVPLSP